MKSTEPHGADRVQYPPTTILRANPGMIRDFWWELDLAGDKFLVIRQVKLDNDSSTAHMKTMRLNEAELAIIMGSDREPIIRPPAIRVFHDTGKKEEPK